MSEIRATTISDAAGTGPITLTGQSAAKVWVSVNQTGTQAILNSFNVSSITDTEVGRTAVNHLSGMSSSAYSAVASGNGYNYSGNQGGIVSAIEGGVSNSKTSTRHVIDFRTYSNTNHDVDDAATSVFGDLA